MEINTVTITGYIATEIDVDSLRKTSTGTSVINFNMACEKENNQNEADFIKCTAYGKIAENILKYIKKGSHVVIEGRVCSNVYQDDQQVNHYETYIYIKKIRF